MELISTTDETIRLRSMIRILDDVSKSEGLGEGSSYYQKFNTWIDELASSKVTRKVPVEELSSKRDVNTQVRWVILALQNLNNQIVEAKKNNGSNRSTSRLSSFLSEDQRLMLKPSREKIQALLNNVLVHYQENDILEALRDFDEYMPTNDQQAGVQTPVSLMSNLNDEELETTVQPEKIPFRELYQMAREADGEPLGYVSSAWNKPKKRLLVYQEINRRIDKLPQQNQEFIATLLAHYEAWVTENLGLRSKDKETNNIDPLPRVPSLQALVMTLIASEILTDDRLENNFGPNNLPVTRQVLLQSVFGDIQSLIEDGVELSELIVNQLIDSRLEGRAQVDTNLRNLRRRLSELLRDNVVSFWGAIKKVLMPAA